ncbi:MAG TPA: GTP 3',8-cyclase MoaA [Rhodospirillaceae bacterium]|nr:GTP 3',8-cyclase MoaA [Rhodospirillaceae bacterium]
MIDPFGRSIHYLRLSVTDRCNLRCRYCMGESPEFLPKSALLSLEELARLAEAFITLGIRKIRLTGGEPLVRRGLLDLVRSLGRHLTSGRLEELTLSTNGVRLPEFAEDLRAAGIKRVNVSLDSLDRARFQRITRSDGLEQVLAGLAAAKAAGLKVKINTVALLGINEDEIDDLIRWCGDQGFDLTLIETMPMGEVDEDRTDRYLPLDKLRRDLGKKWRLQPLALTTGGPASYCRVQETGGLLGFITPLTHNFCEGCNRVRVTCTGKLYMCLGQEDSADLQAVLRDENSNHQALEAAILSAIRRKPKGHDFIIDRQQSRPALGRHMNTTGG